MVKKHCTGCDTMYPQTTAFFHRNRKAKDGLQNYCKECQKGLQRRKRDRIKSGDHVVRSKPVASQEGHKICSQCFMEFPATREYFHKYNMGVDGLKPECRGCAQDRVKNRRRKSWSHRLVTYCRGRHVTKGYLGVFDLSSDLLEEMFEAQEGKCYWTGVPLLTEMLNGGEGELYMLTIDRLDSSKGYVSDNIVLATKAANQARGSVPAERFRKFLREINVY